MLAVTFTNPLNMQRVIKKPLLLSAILLFPAFSCLAQIDRAQIADSITREGKRLYESEMASWYGTDVFLAKFKEEKENIGGYFSYKDGSSYKCLFFSKSDKPTVLGTITFKGSYDPEKAESDGTKRDLTEKEMDYYLIRKSALDEFNSDTLFETYKNTSINIIPLIDDNSKKVYIITATGNSGVVLIGNDYLLTFDKNNKLASKKKIHANLISIKTKEEQNQGDTKVATGSVHNHLPETGDFITATDVCTFMLYKKFSNWKQQIVISKKYMSIWNCESESLVIIPTGK